MRKSPLIFTVILIACLAAWTFFPKSTPKFYEHSVANVFNQSTIDFISSNISFNGLLINRTMSGIDLEKVVNDIAEDLHLEVIESQDNKSDTYSEYAISSRMGQNDIIKLKAFCKQPSIDEKAGSYINLEFYRDDILGSLDYTKAKEKIENVLLKYAQDLEVTDTMVGAYNGELDGDDMEIINSKIFGEKNEGDLLAEQVDESTTIFAFNKNYINPFHKYYKTKDLQASFRYNRLEDKTYIMLKRLERVE